jgi:hypothetical protein
MRLCTWLEKPKNIPQKNTLASAWKGDGTTRVVEIGAKDSRFRRGYLYSAS